MSIDVLASVNTISEDGEFSCYVRLAYVRSVSFAAIVAVKLFVYSHTACFETDISACCGEALVASSISDRNNTKQACLLI